MTCSACALGKIKKHTHKPKNDDSIQEKLYLLHMDLCGPMRIKSINGKKYILNDVVKRRNRTLVEAARTMLIFSKAPLFLWVEAVATSCFTQNRSLIQRRHNKTPYELIHYIKRDLTYFNVFGALFYPTNDGEDPRPELQLTTPGTISSGLVHNPPSPTPYVPPTKNDWDLWFQPMFDEYFIPPPSVVSPVPVVVAPRPANPSGSPSSTSIDQDAPSSSTSSTIQVTQSPVIYEGVEEEL
ncbi:retrovirus-related pol polyprotein from transposon TNT 1-94 [Tanacetum coccineum]